MRLNQPTKSVTDDEGGENRRRSRTRAKGNPSSPRQRPEPRITHASRHGHAAANRGGVALAGGHTRGETPVPIPNTAVKPAGPMILPQRESRSVPAIKRKTPIRKLVGVLFCAHYGG